MRIRSFIIAYALVLAILLFADRRPGSIQQDRYSHVVDLTDGQNTTGQHAAAAGSRTRIIAPGALIPGTWAAGQIPPERLVAPLVVMDLNAAMDGSPQISLDDIAAWESRHGLIPQGAVVAIRRSGARDDLSIADLLATPLPIARDAAMFLIEARYTIAFAVETPVNLTSDKTLARQLALHGNYVVEGTARFTALPATGSLIIVAPARNKEPGEAPVRILAMVR
jgi:kynurenine formamidase